MSTGKLLILREICSELVSVFLQQFLSFPFDESCFDSSHVKLILWAIYKDYGWNYSM